MKFREVPDRTAAEALGQRYVFVDEAAVPPAPEGAFWPHQLEGCEVVTEEGRSLGVIREVVHGVANDIWVAGDGEPEVLVPALKDVVVSVDVEPVEGDAKVGRDVGGKYRVPADQDPVGHHQPHVALTVRVHAA